MNGMWRRWAQRKRLVGVAYLGGAAIALAVAFLVWAVGGGWLVGFPILAFALLIVLAGYAFIDAHRYAKQVHRA